MPEYAATDVLHVAVGVLQDADGQWLVSQRPAGKALAGAWEFPGGKVAAGEQPSAALLRELQEELGIEARLLRFLACYPYRYPERTVELHVWRVLHWRGSPVGREGQSLQWVTPAALAALPLLPADAPLLALLQAGSAVNTASWEPALAD